MHLLLACATWPFEGPAPDIAALRLPHVERLLGLLQAGTPMVADPASLCPPQERLRAADLGWPLVDGGLPWAALAARDSLDPQGEQAWAWISPAHWEVGSAAVTMAAPPQLRLDAEASRALCEAMAPYFAEDGITLHYHEPARWLAASPRFEGMVSASLDRVAGQSLADWMPEAGWLRRLQNEMQMLLYLHPVNDARQTRGELPVNAFWLHGSGRLPPGTPAAPAALPVEPEALRQAVWQRDPAAWLQAWQALDAGEARSLLHTVERGDTPARLSLCGTRGAITFGPQRRGTLARWGARLRPPALTDWLQQL